MVLNETQLLPPITSIHGQYDIVVSCNDIMLDAQKRVFMSGRKPHAQRRASQPSQGDGLRAVALLRQ